MSLHHFVKYQCIKSYKRKQEDFCKCKLHLRHKWTNGRKMRRSFVRFSVCLLCLSGVQGYPSHEGNETRCFIEILEGGNRDRNLVSWLSGKSLKLSPLDVTFWGSNARNSIPASLRSFVRPSLRWSLTLKLHLRDELMERRMDRRREWNLAHFNLQMWHLVAIILLFPDNPGFPHPVNFYEAIGSTPLTEQPTKIRVSSTVLRPFLF